MFVVSVMFNKKNYISCFGKGKNNENFMLSNIFLKITGTLLIIFHNANNRVTPPSPPHHTLSNQSAFGHIHSNVVHSTLMWSACKPGYLDTPGRSQASASVIWPTETRTLQGDRRNPPRSESVPLRQTTPYRHRHGKNWCTAWQSNILWGTVTVIDESILQTKQYLPNENCYAIGS